MSVIKVQGYNTCVFKAIHCFLKDNNNSAALLDEVFKKLREFVRKNDKNLPKDITMELLIDMLDERAQRDLSKIQAVCDLIGCPITVRDKDMKEIKSVSPVTTISDAITVELVCIQQPNALDHFDYVRKNSVSKQPIKPADPVVKVDNPKTDTSFNNETNVPLPIHSPNKASSSSSTKNEEELIQLSKTSTSTTPPFDQNDEYEEIASTETGKNMRKALDEFQNQPLPGPVVDLKCLSNYQDVSELLHRLEETLKSTQADSNELALSLLEELCWKCGIFNLFPKTIIIGMESVGKSSVIEALLGIALSYTAKKKATVAPVFVTIRKVNNLKETQYVCKLSRKGVTETVLIEKLREKMQQEMEAIKKSEGYSLEPFILTIETGNPKATTMSFIDVPGMIQSVANEEHKHLNDEEKKKLIKSVKYITEYVVTENSDSDIVLVVESILNPSSHHKISELPFLKKFDPKRKLFAVTHGDILVEMFKNADAATIQSHIKEFTNLFGKQPYLLALHEPYEKKDSNFESQRNHITTSGGLRERIFVNFLEKKGVSADIRNTVGIENVKTAIMKLRRQQFLANASNLKSKIKEAVSQLSAQEKQYLEKVKLEESQRTDVLLNHMFQELKKEFTNTFNGIYSINADTVADEHRKTLKEEFTNIGELKLPSSTVYLNGVKMMPSMDLDYLCERSFNWDLKLSNGFQRVQRFISFLILSVSSVEVEDCDRAILLDQQQSGHKADYVVGLAAVASVTTKLAKIIFGEDALNYTQTFFIALIKNYLEFIQNIVCQNPEFQNKQALLQSLVAVMEERVENLIKDKMVRVKKDACDVFDNIRVNTIDEMTHLHRMIYSPPSQGNEDALGREERIDLLSKLQNTTVNLNDTSVDEVKRRFSSLREIFRMNIEKHIDALSKLITGDDREGLFETVYRSIFNNEDGSRKTVEDLEAEFSHQPETDAWKARQVDVAQRKAILYNLLQLFVKAIDRVNTSPL